MAILRRQHQSCLSETVPFIDVPAFGKEARNNRTVSDNYSIAKVVQHFLILAKPNIKLPVGHERTRSASRS